MGGGKLIIRELIYKFDTHLYKFLLTLSIIFLVGFFAFPSGAQFGILFFSLLTFFCILQLNLKKFAQAGNKKCENISYFLTWLFILWGISFIIIECTIIAGFSTDAEAYDADYIIILGAGVDYDKPSGMLRSRLDAALTVLVENPNAKAVTTGGKSPEDLYSEAETMANYLIERGIDGDRIIIEQNSTNTDENVEFATRLIERDAQERGLTDYTTAVVTNEFHLSRARRLLEDNGLTPYGVNAKTPYEGLFYIYMLREYFSIVLFWL